jgi:hypothetical protein
LFSAAALSRGLEFNKSLSVQWRALPLAVWRQGCLFSPMRPLFLSVILSLVLFAPCRAEPPFDPAKLVGEWRYENEPQNQVARYVFGADGTFTAELFQGGESVRKFTGRWKIEEGTILYTYETDSVGKVGAGARERDRLIRLDESSYTIEGGDGGQRSYWRVKASK